MWWYKESNMFVELFPTGAEYRLGKTADVRLVETYLQRSSCSHSTNILDRAGARHLLSLRTLVLRPEQTVKI